MPTITNFGGGGGSSKVITRYYENKTTSSSTSYKTDWTIQVPPGKTLLVYAKSWWSNDSMVGYRIVLNGSTVLDECVLNANSGRNANSMGAFAEYVNTGTTEATITCQSKHGGTGTDGRRIYYYMFDNDLMPTS